MAEFLTTKGIQSSIESIITTARKKIVIISPYIKLSDYFLDTLTQASKKGVIVKIVYGKSDLHANVLGNIGSLENVELFYYENLHAKCYLNESRMVITSMNLYHASEKNREMGVLIDRAADKSLFENALNEVQLILESPLTQRHAFQKKALVKELSSPLNGHCIRCNKKIAFNPESPYCKPCYKTWSYKDDEDEYFPENYCHNCGTGNRSTFIKPECFTCYKLGEYENDVGDIKNPLTDCTIS